MGCSASKPLNNNGQCTCECHKKAKTNSQTQKMTDIPEDPRIPLTSREKFLLQKSWKAIGRNIVDTGMNIFLSLFEINPDAQKYFSSIAHISTLSDLRESTILAKHVRAVMFTIDDAIAHITDGDHVIDMLTQVGHSHTRFKDYNPQVFYLIIEPFLRCVKDTLNDRFTVQVENIYTKTITFIVDTMKAGFNSDKVGTNGSA